MAISISGTTLTFNDATTQTTAAVVSTSTVLAATAGASYNVVGTYTIARTTSNISAGSTIAGSSLLAVSIAVWDPCSGVLPVGIASTSGALSGTWRAMSHANIGGSTIRAALWLRTV